MIIENQKKKIQLSIQFFNSHFSILHSQFGMRLLLVSGSSGGHLTPLIAVERAVKKLAPKTQTHFLCSKKPEDAAYLEHEGVEFTQATLPKKNIFFPITYLRSHRTAKRVLKTFKPDIIFSKGGAISVPLCRAAHKQGIPIIIHESDSVMGKANKMIAPIATAICLGFPPSDEQRSFGKIPIVTGNPIRQSMTQGKRERGLDLTNFAGKRPVLLVTGGSQGASALNNAITMHLDALLEICDVIHLTGRGKKGASRRAGYWAREFVYKELPDLYAITTLALSRAGAASIGELAANEIPMILVPIRGLANDHQYENAVRAEAKGAAVILPQTHLETDLVKIVQSLLAKKSETLSAMRAATAELRQPEAARRIAQIILKSVAQDRKND